MADEGVRDPRHFPHHVRGRRRWVNEQPLMAIASDVAAINLEAPGWASPRNLIRPIASAGALCTRGAMYLLWKTRVRNMTSLPHKFESYPTERPTAIPASRSDVVLACSAKGPGNNSLRASPKSYPGGNSFVVVKWRVVIDNGNNTGLRPGKIIYGRVTRLNK